MSRLESFIEGLIKEDMSEKEGGENLTPADKINLLKRQRLAMEQPINFIAGDIIRWRGGLRNRNLEGPFIALEIIETPLENKEHKTGSAYYCDNLDTKIGMLDSDGDYIEYYLDSRRLEKL